jgi:choline dehydrogenase-like flavoprotein
MPASRPDVVVVGAGASGALLTHRLATRGFRVTCLEQGRWWNPSEYPGGSAAFELASTGPFHPNPNLRGRDEDYPCVVSESDVNPLMFNAVGGSTIHYAAIWTRQRPADFRLRTLHGAGDDWPISYEDLEPYYQQAEQELWVSGLSGDPAYPPTPPLPLPAFPIGPGGRVMANGMNRLGWHWWPAVNGMRSRAAGGLAACLRRGTCGGGCPEGAKSSVDTTHWPAAIGAGARLVCGARARQVVIDARGRASGVVYIDRDGREHRVDADCVVLAANGVGTPRLLLVSASARFPDGVANRSGLVGKRLMLHPYAKVAGVYEQDLTSERGPHGAMLVSHQFAEPPADAGFVGTTHWELTPLGGPLATLEGSGHDARVVGDRFGAAFHAAVRGAFGHMIAWGFTAEDLPVEENTVTLDPVVTDSDGVPAPRIRYRIDDNTRTNLAFQVARARDAHEAAGATRVHDYPRYPDCGWHLLGTTRMGDDPASSVVDSFGRSHDVANLFIVDGGVFVTSAAVNPTATISAFALRTADHIAATASTTATAGEHGRSPLV